MNAQQRTVAEECLAAAYGNTMSFPDSVRALIESGFAGYLVDYRRNTRTYYVPSGASYDLNNPHAAHSVASSFDAGEIAAAVKWAQSAAADYTYAAFNSRITASGCAGYLVSFSGRRVVYFGGTGETHTEYFPQ